MDKLVINILEKDLCTPFGIIKTNDFTFQNNITILQNNQDIVYKLIKANISRKLIEHDLNIIASYQSIIIWLFDKNTIINKIVKTEKRKTSEFVFIIICFFFSVALLFYLYKHDYFIGIGIYFIILVTFVGLYIVFKKFRSITKEKYIELQQLEIIKINTNKIINFINLVDEIYDSDLFLSIKNHIKDPLIMIRHTIEQSDGIYKITANRKKYSRLFTKILEYLGILDIYITIAKCVIYNNYILTKYVDSIDLYLEIIGDDTRLVLGSENTHIMYVTGNYEKRNQYIEHILKNIYLSQSLGISNFRKFKHTPFSAIIDQQIVEIPNILETVKNNLNQKYFIVLTFTREMNHYFLELLIKLIKYKNIILILSIDDTIKELEIDKFIIKEF